MEDKRKYNGKNLIKYKGKLHPNWRGGITGNYKEQYRLRKLRFPLKVRVQRKLSNAVLNGKIGKPNICERCKIVKNKRFIDGHHSDYLKPFDVQWLCRQCHCYIHRGHKKTS